MICCLDKRAQVESHFVGVKFLIPIVKIALVDAALGEEINDVHEELLVDVFHVGNDGEEAVVERRQLDSAVHHCNNTEEAGGKNKKKGEREIPT